MGHIEIPEWAQSIVANDDRQMTINSLAALISGEHRQTATKLRNESMRALFAQGMNKADLARMFNLGWAQTSDIIEESRRAR
jgi:hypothetical protein